MLQDSKLFQKRIEDYSIFEKVHELKHYLNQQNRGLLMRTNEETDMEQIFVDLLRSEKAANLYNL